MKSLSRPVQIALRVFTYALALLVAYVVSRSVWSPAPVKPADVVVFVSHARNGAVLTEVRKYVGFSREAVGVNRIIFQESDPGNYFIAESGGFQSLIGEFPVLNTYVLPNWVSGRWCSAVTLSWWPAMSQRDYTIPASTVCFETTEYE